MSPARRSSPTRRLALAWGAAAVLLGIVGTVLLVWTAWSTDDGLGCEPPYDGGGAACQLYGAWIPVLVLAGLLASAALLSTVVGCAVNRR